MQRGLWLSPSSHPGFHTAKSKWMHKDMLIALTCCFEEANSFFGLLYSYKVWAMGQNRYVYKLLINSVRVQKGTDISSQQLFGELLIT